MEKRFRSNRVTFRLDDSELTYLNDKLKELNFENREQYCRKMVLDGVIIKVDTSEIRMIQKLFSNISSNVNQVAKKVNESDYVSKKDIEILQDEQVKLREVINEVELVLIKLNK